MRDFKKQERTAIEAVASRFSAIWEEGGDRADAYVVVAGKRIPVHLATLKRRGTRRGAAARLRLRFDRVATRLIERLQTAAAKTVPAGTTLVLAITAPIHLPSKTAAALEDRLRTLVGRGTSGGVGKDTVHGNRIHVRLFNHGRERAPKMIGFVHNPDSDPLQLLTMTRELFELVSAAAGRRPTTRTGVRWLVVTGGDTSELEAYRHVCSCLDLATDFKKILIVSGDGRVEALAS